MTKLRSHTIVPADLYVRRRADDQLAQIIEDMGRPGYVLVARQMGKTNLLLNAKRRSEPADLYVYLDVSNVFPDLRSFLRNIVDVAIESLQDGGVFLSEIVQRDRAADELLPHKEHERELRRILQTVSGRLIICLDEIDALTKTQYSDHVFSFIRSIYFSGRANIQDFSRLTYILSGVAEPTDLIKNKAISPFNIGEKIYLDDFSLSEVEEFLGLAGLEYSAPIRERIFYWTAGHPRMTWDVASAIERAPDSPTVESVDAAVRDMYFGTVDVPPVDHIKSLVESSREVRDALVAIHYGKAESLADGLRTKLYLAGISRYDTHTKQTSFKNRVLEAALSETFLRSVDARQSSFEIGLKHIKSKTFDEALGAFREFIKSQPTDPRVPVAQYWGGVACYQLGQYREAVRFFSVPNVNLPVSSVVARYFFHGMSHYLLGEYGTAVPLLQQAVAGRTVSDYPERYFEAKVFLSAALLHFKPTPGDDAFRTAVALSAEVLTERRALYDHFAETEEAKRLLLKAELNLAEAAQQDARREQAVEHLNQAREYADAPGQLTILLFEHRLARGREEATAVLDRAIRQVFDIRVFDDESYGGQASTLTNAVELLGKLQKSGKIEDFNRVIDHVVDHLSGKIGVYAFVTDLVLGLFTAGRHQAARRIVDRSLRIQEARGEDAGERRSMLALAIAINEAEADNYGPEYLESFDHAGVNVAETDLRFLTPVVTAAINRGNLSVAARARDVAMRYPALQGSGGAVRQSSSAELLQEYLDLLVKLRVAPGAAVYAQCGALLRRLGLVRNFNLPYFPDGYHKLMQMDLHRRVRGVATVPFRREKKKYGRNDVVVVSYESGTKKGKFKTFADDLARGICKIVDETPVDS